MNCSLPCLHRSMPRATNKTARAALDAPPLYFYFPTPFRGMSQPGSPRPDCFG
jgi:hypothetical protein